MSLPMWPGFCFDRNLGKLNRPRIQVLDKIMNTSYPYYNDKLLKSNISRCDIPSEQHGLIGPSWVVFDKKVLSFDGYWLETLMEDPDKPYNTRNCKVYFYLEDDTIQVLEPRIRNSRLCQGTVVRRGKILKPFPNDNTYYNVCDLNIGGVLQLFGKYIKLISCDQFTHNFLRRLGINIPNPIQPLVDPIDSVKSKILGGQKKSKGVYVKKDNLNQFLNFTKFILRFYCFWDNSDLLSDPRSMTLHYFLEDDTIEILENFRPNCGREGKLFLKRQKLPKHSSSASLNFPSQSSDPSYLNVITTRDKQHKLHDSTDISDNSHLFYRSSDLSLGQYVNVYGRKFLLCDCDEFTKEYYRTKFGIHDFRSIDINQYWKKGEDIPKFIPPYNGWGAEDSLINCLSIRPTEIIKSNKKFVNSKRTINDLLFLNFLAKIDNPETKLDKERRFIISYSVEHDLFSILEKNNGNKSLFLSRDRHMKSKSIWKDISIPEYYEITDFYIGAKLHLKGTILVIFSSDDYTLTYMEKNCHEFIYSSIERILGKLAKHLNRSKNDVEYFFKNEDSAHLGYIHFNVLETFKLYLADNIISIQELITLGRHYSYRNEEPIFNMEESKAKIRDSLRKVNFMDYYIIKIHWYAQAPDSRSLPLPIAKSILKACKLPLSDDLICDLLKLSSLDSHEVDLCILLEIIEWQKYHTDYYNSVGKFLKCEEINFNETDLTEVSPEKHFKIGKIYWQRLVKDILTKPQISKSHPSSQKMMYTTQCQETYE